MNKDHTASFRWVLLTGARVIGVVFSIIIPMYLGRKLSVESYGTYKQIMLLFWFSQVALNLGIDDSAYYNLRLDPKRFPLYSFNALVFNLLATGALWAAMVFFSHEISLLLKNPEIEPLLSILGFLILVTISSMQIEGILIGMNLFQERLWVEVGVEVLKVIGILWAFYFYNSIYIALIVLSILMSVRLLGTILLIFHYKQKEKIDLKEAPSLVISQLKFGLPLGFSRILQNILNMENFFISSFFNLTQFTYYSVGCFENPLVNATRTSLYEIGNIEMIDAIKNEGKKAAIDIWKKMSRKLLLVVIPFVVYMIFFAKEIIIFIFSSKYLPSVPYFIVFNFYLIVGSLNPEPIFRAISQTQHAFKIKFVGVLIGIALLVLGAVLGGPLWALVGKICGVFFMNLAGLIIGAKLLEANFFDFFYWKDLGKTLIISLGATFFLRLIFLHSFLHPFWVLSISFSIFICFYFFLLYFFRVLKEEEIKLLKKIILRKN